MTVVVAAPNVRAQVFAHLERDATLLAMLPQGVNSILPRKVLRGGQWQAIDPQTAKRPFIWVRREPGVPLGDMQPDLEMWAFEVHDQQIYGYVDIDRIIARIKWIFDGAEWHMATATLPAYVSYWAGASGEVTDSGWTTVKRIGRIQVLMS